MSDKDDILGAFVLSDDFSSPSSPFGMTTFLGQDLLPAINRLFIGNDMAGVVFQRLCEEREFDFPFMVLILDGMGANADIVANIYGGLCVQDIDAFVDIVGKDDKSLLDWPISKKPNKIKRKAIPDNVVEIPTEDVVEPALPAGAKGPHVGFG